MNKLSFIVFLSFTCLACSPNEKVKESTEYSFLKTCFEDYYLNYNIEITDLLNDFELLLLKEGHLKDTTGEAYKSLFDQLEKDNFFTEPLTKDEFNKIALYKNPTHLIQCASDLFGIDSVEIAKTNFFKITREINKKIQKEKDISIHFFFNQYKKNLTNQEFRSPYIKQSIQLLLYRWYYKSKFEKNSKLKEVEE